MPSRRTIPDPVTAAQVLRDLWEDVLSEPDNLMDSEIQSLIDSQYVSVRYSLPTQVLGKLTSPGLDCLCLQKGKEEDESSWDPRSFCNKVIVPWVDGNHAVLGTSSDPYVSKPLRKPRLEPEPGNVKGAEDWKLLYRVLAEIQHRNEEDYTRKRMREILRAIRSALDAVSFVYEIPDRVSLEQTLTAIQCFLAEGSGGDRGVAVAAAFFETIGACFGIYSDVRRNVINASDASTGATADIECYDGDGALRLAVEVKERKLTVADVRSAIGKARRFSLKELLFNVPGAAAGEEQELEALFARTWASGTNLYSLSIEELTRTGLALAGERARHDFLRNIGEQLDRYNTQPSNRKRWKEILDTL